MYEFKGFMIVIVELRWLEVCRWRVGGNVGVGEKGGMKIGGRKVKMEICSFMINIF